MGIVWIVVGVVLLILLSLVCVTAEVLCYLQKKKIRQDMEQIQ